MEGEEMGEYQDYPLNNLPDQDNDLEDLGLEYEQNKFGAHSLSQNALQN